jgi:hypothetical protein
LEAQIWAGEHGEHRTRRCGRERHRLRDRVRSLVFRSLIPAPTWVWLAVLGVGVLLALKDGISAFDVVTLAVAGFMIVGSVMSVADTATEAPDLTLKEPIPVPAGYGFRQEDSAVDSTRIYRSEPLPAVKRYKQAVAEANQAVEEVVDYYIAGLPPEWTIVERKEDVGYGDGLNAQAKFRQGDTSNGIGIQVYPDMLGLSDTTVVLMIDALNCGEDVPGFPSGEVCWQGPV